MKNFEYDFDKETDKDFLREAGKMLQKEVIELRIQIIQLKLQKSQDEEIKKNLTGQLLILRRSIFDSKQERKDRLKQRKKQKKGSKLIHNRNQNKESLEDSHKDIELVSDEVVHEIEDQNCSHCSESELKELGGLFEESTEFDVNTTFYILKRHKRKKYKCPGCQKITTAKGPEKLKAGSQFSIQLATKIAVDKFNFHMPLERQRKQMKDDGVNVSVKTLFSLTEHLYQLLLPLEKLNREDILLGDYTCMDESPMNFFNPNKSKGYVWTLSNQYGAYYQFEPTRSGEVAKEMIRGFQGVVVTDGFGGYGFLNEEEGIVHVYCWAHMRRYFYDAMAEDQKAGEIVDLIDQLYEIEHEAQNLEELELLRKSRSTPIFQEIEAWVSENDSRYLDSTLTGKAIKYFYNQKEGLEVFLKNPLAPIDNNIAERRQRCPVMGRKNYLAFRSINGADIGMFFYSIIESCKTNGLQPSGYIQDMALRAARGEELESPYKYASRLKQEIVKNLSNSIKKI